MIYLEKTNKDRKGVLMSQPTQTLPTRQVIINHKIDESRQKLIASQLHVQFLEEYLKALQDEDNMEITETYLTRNSAELMDEVQLGKEKNQYLLAEMLFYKRLRDESIEARQKKDEEVALEAYKKAPGKIKIKSPDSDQGDVMVVKGADLLSADSSAEE